MDPTEARPHPAAAPNSHVQSSAPHVIIVGAGPAGSVAAAILAREGLRVTLVERERFPRHHVGESLQPATLTLLERHLGLGAAIDAMGFPRKYGAVYVWGEDRAPWSVLFDGRLEAELAGLDEAGLLGGGYEHAYNVDRLRFDHLLYEAAGAAGAEHRRAVALSAQLDGPDGRFTGLRVRDEDDVERVIPGDFLIDASGQAGLMGRQLQLTQLVSDLQSTASYAYFDGAGGVSGPLGRHVQLVVTVEEGWAWFIPVAPDRTSVGVVTKDRARMSLERFQAIVERAELPLQGARLAPGPRGETLRFARDWSFVQRQLSGPGWLMAGDAACFVDPILSGGVDFAVRGGCKAATLLLRSFGEPGAEEAELRAVYEEELRREYKAYLRLARYWYGNNRSVQGLFWEAHREIPAGATATPLRAFVYLTTGRYAAERHLRVFDVWQEQKMFRQLGVDAAALRRAREAAARGS